MLKTQEIVNFVNEKLNEIGTTDDYSFDIHSNIGENGNNGALNGILYATQVSTMPIPDYTENTYNFVVEILVPSARANYHFEKVQSIIEKFVNDYDGHSETFGAGKGLMNITPGKPENFNVAYNGGENVPLYFAINVLYTEDAETSSDVHWLLDGLEIPYINDDIIVDKEGNINKIYGKKASQTFLTGQTKFYRFVFPKRKDALGKKIQNDLLGGDFDKQYTLTYYDGEDYTEEEPFETKVSIFRSGNKNGKRGKVNTYDLTFAEVDDESDTTIYEIALIDNQFDNQAEDTRWFDAVVEDGEITKTAQEVQQEYYEDKIEDEGCDWERIKAPNLNSLDITSQVYPNTNGYELFDLVKKNYAIIKVTKGEWVENEQQQEEFVITSTEYYYYYVTNAQIGQNNQVLFDLKMDTLQTYMFDSNLQFSDSYIEKANLNRWVQVDANTVAFKGDASSDLFEKEELQNVAKRLVNRNKVSLNNFFTAKGFPEADTWLDNNVIAWVYVFLDPVHTFKQVAMGDTDIGDDTRINSRYDELYIKGKGVYSELLSTNLVCVCYPLYQRDVVDEGDAKDLENKIHICYEQSGTLYRRLILDSKAYRYFMKYNNDNSFTIGVKVSLVSPFSTASGITGDVRVEIESSKNNLLIIQTSPTWIEQQGITIYKQMAHPIHNEGTGHSQYPNSVIQKGLYNINRQGANIEFSWTGTYNTQFLKSAITGTALSPATKDPKFNPKLLSQEYHSLKLTNQDADGFEYDIQKLGTNTLNFSYTEPLTPDISRSYIRLKNATGLYTEGTTENFTGTVSTNDNSLIRVTSAYQQMLAEQKNFYQQNSTNRTWNVLQGIGLSVAGTIGGALLGGPIGATAVAGTILGGVGTALNSVRSSTNEKFTIDNLKNAPSSVQNAKGNVFLNAMTTKLGVYVEEYDILTYEKTIVNDYMMKYGFTANKFGNIREHCIIRHYFNYVKAQIGSIYGVPMSNIARADMRQRFANGVRFWKSDNIDYSKENYEEWLTTNFTSYENWLASQQ